MCKVKQFLKTRSIDQLLTEGGKVMKSKLTLSFLALSGLAFVPSVSFAAKHKGTVAQGEDKTEKSDKVRRVKGCLSKEGDEYKLMADNGDTWELKGDTVNLADHVGHMVSVTGTVDHAKMHEAKEKAKEKTQDNPKEHGHLTVTNIKHIGQSCSK
jgi:Protein of unknown function (DUF5818)